MLAGLVTDSYLLPPARSWLMGLVEDRHVAIWTNNIAFLHNVGLIKTICKIEIVRLVCVGEEFCFVTCSPDMLRAC